MTMRLWTERRPVSAASVWPELLKYLSAGRKKADGRSRPHYDKLIQLPQRCSVAVRDIFVRFDCFTKISRLPEEVKDNERSKNVYQPELLQTPLKPIR